MRYFISSFIFYFFCFVTVRSQSQYNSSEILHGLQQLNTVGKVLYVAAHPDDENTRLITWLANEKNLETAYFSFTRGEGGQNLIGNELGFDLGWIRSHELLQARKVDGGIQFFSRAEDFGYSKTTTETFSIWKKEDVMADLVWVIRTFQPDVIITRFSPQPSKTHGHHTASAMLAVEAMQLAADSSKYSEQLKYTNTWQVNRVLWNTSSFFFENEKQFNKDTFIQVNVGQYNPNLGTSYTEIAAKSRSCHKSQGFGTLPTRGDQIEYFVHLAGEKPLLNDLFSGLELNWNRIPQSNKIQQLINKILSSYKPSDPSLITNDLLALYRLLNQHPEKKYLQHKINLCKELIRHCLGLYVEMSAPESIYSIGDSLPIQLEVINRSGKHVEHVAVHFPDFIENKKTEIISCSTSTLFKKTYHGNFIKSVAEVSKPLWWNASIENEFSYQMMQFVTDGEEFKDRNYLYTVVFSSKDTLQFSVPLLHKKSDPVKGEVIKPLYFAPPVTATSSSDLVMFTDNNSHTISIELQSFLPAVKGKVMLDLPPGWSCSPAYHNFQFSFKREKKSVSFSITPPSKKEIAAVRINVLVDDKNYSNGFKEINYDHIPSLVYFPPSEIRLVKDEIKTYPKTIGYLDGAGDDVDMGLQQLGYSVEYIEPDNINADELQKYKTIVVGVRAYNTHENSTYINQQLNEYVKQGGVVVMQYITTAGLKTKNIGPYPLTIGRDRVTEENAIVQMLQPDNSLFNIPNKITSSDWENWTQERGLYFASSWDNEKYTALLSMNDTNEPEKKGSLLLASYGKGYFIYTGLSFFRQIPYGNSGAYKLLVNAIEYGK
jgi:LmbE family N-acetylglucosaminyl deacetylase